MMQTVHRLEPLPETAAPQTPVELSDATLGALVSALDAFSEPDSAGRRDSARLRIQGRVMMTQLDRSEPNASSPCEVGIYDISRSGIAIVDERPMERGTQFSVLLPRAGSHPVEMICTAVHSREQDGAFVIGARYGSNGFAYATDNDAAKTNARSKAYTGSIEAVLRAKGAGPPA